jgi:hypothetical protein
MLEGVLIDETIQVLFEFTGHFARSTRARAIQQTLCPLIGKALHPFSESGIGKVEGLGDRVDVLARDDLTKGLSPAKDTGLFGLLEHGF